MHNSHEWKVAPWVWADCPETAGHPVWNVWANVYLRAMAHASRYKPPGKK